MAKSVKHSNSITTLLGLLLISFVILSSCTMDGRSPSSVSSALGKAGENRSELLKVIRHYSKIPKDSLKLKAAYFLISRMPGHAYRSKYEVFNPVFDSVATYQNFLERIRFFSDEMERIKQEYPAAYSDASVVGDLEHVSAEFLIENIDLSFKAHNRMPVEHRSGLNHFFEYVLPYRSSDEPLEFGNRKKQFLKYQWVHEELQAGQPLQKVVRSVLDSMGLDLHMVHGYPGRLSVSQVEETRFGICTELVNYAVSVFRAIGIPASNDFTPHWGNRYDNGHNWLAIHLEDSLLAIGLPGKMKLNYFYRHGSLPKMYRHTYGAQ